MSQIEKYSHYAIQLQEAIFTNNKPKIFETLINLIKSRVNVEIIPMEIRYPCCCHQYYKGNFDSFSVGNVIFPAFCSNSHTLCVDCTVLYVKSSFYNYYLQNLYQCPGCLLIDESSESQLFSDELLEDSLRFCVGENILNNVKLEIPEAPPLIVPFRKTCIACKTNANVLEICEHGDLYCKACVINWAKSNHPPLKCINNSCSGALNFSTIISILKDTDALFYINSELVSVKIRINFCKSCKIMIQINTSSESTTCKCGAKVCSQCYELDHFGFTCFYNISTQQYEKIILQPPIDPNYPQTILEHEYQKVKYAFNNFVKGRYKFVGATLIVNKPLEQRYSQKKNLMAQQCGGRDKINEVYIWHGSNPKNYEAIMHDGLKVGGVDPGVPVAVGTACGFGIYSATNPDTPIGYSQGCGLIICCLAMKGNNSTTTIANAAQLNNGSTHSYARPPDWVIFFTKEQVLPRYLVQFQAY